MRRLETENVPDAICHMPTYRIVPLVIRHMLRAHERENAHERFLPANLAENEPKKKDSV